ncbi:MAG TPA: heterodisulfide reductase-related iron-sulfur binding cluster [Chloroflexota bacterium]|nr:heterodisulfide reductase-related iron-sulfur binding cluster [Chloroflexota bacterium]
MQPAFDAHDPPSLQLIDECVHCGFCLSSCPTYLLWGEEMDSPRGRIYLMREGLQGEPLSAAMVSHYDRCLGCVACEPACPSGVQYGKLIEATRQQVERRYPRSIPERMYRDLLYELLPYPARLSALRPLLALARRLGLLSRATRLPLPERLQTVTRLGEVMPLSTAQVPEWTPAAGDERLRVGLLLGCIQRAFFSEVNAATTRVLSADGCGVAAPGAQGCCGALSEHGGRRDEALRLARRLIDTFETADVDVIAVNVAGCGSMMKEYGYLLRDDPMYAERARRFSERVRDVSELLQEIGPRADRHPLPMSVVYHDACHLSNAQGIRAQPRATLRQIPGLEVREVPRERDICCGSAGIYNLLQPNAAGDLGDRKAANVLDAKADLLVTANPGCHLQIVAAAQRHGVQLPAVHVMQVVDASIRALGVETLTRAQQGTVQVAGDGV